MAALSERITDDLRLRLSEEGGEPVVLTLEALSRDYACSTQPVRIALAALIEEGTIEKGPNRRLRAAKQASAPRQGSRLSAPAAPESPIDPAATIARYVIERGFGEGEIFLREADTAQRFELSRAQLREVFLRLSAQGLLEHVPRRGWKVRPFRRKDLEDFLHTREALELKALELAWERLEPGRLREMLERNVLDDGTGRLRIDNRLHAYWIERSNNGYITAFFRQHAAYFELLFEWEDRDREAALQGVHQHRAILDCILADDREGARRALSHHIFENHPVLVRIQG